MRFPAFAASVSVFALSGALLASPALAQDAAADGAATDNSEIVVTAAAGDKSARLSSISVSQISQEAVTNFTPRSQAGDGAQHFEIGRSHV